MWIAITYLTTEPLFVDILLNVLFSHSIALSFAMKTKCLWVYYITQNSTRERVNWVLDGEQIISHTWVAKL